MIWRYRAIKNPIARRKWITICLILILIGFGYTAYKVHAGLQIGKALIIAGIFSLFIILYTIIALGKYRYYYIQDGILHYKPFKVDLKSVKGYEVDERNLVIRLKVRNPLSIRTLYFENLEDLKDIEKLLKKIIKK